MYERKFIAFFVPIMEIVLFWKDSVQRGDLTSMKSTLCKTSIVNLAREGRKYDISLCFITQRPRNFDQTALSQSSNKVIFSLPHPDDIKHIMEDAVYYHTEMGNIIQRQRQGQCVIIGDAFESELETEIVF